MAKKINDYRKTEKCEEFGRCRALLLIALHQYYQWQCIEVLIVFDTMFVLKPDEMWMVDWILKRGGTSYIQYIRVFKYP